MTIVDMTTPSLVHWVITGTAAWLAARRMRRFFPSSPTAQIAVSTVIGFGFGILSSYLMSFLSSNSFASYWREMFDFVNHFSQHFSERKWKLIFEESIISLVALHVAFWTAAITYWRLEKAYVSDDRNDP